MLDLSYFQTGNSNVQAFYSNPGGWQTWIKPRGAKSINILCIGAGGGGGSYNAIQQAPGGGAAAGYVRATYQANILPDVLYVQTGIGGAGTTTSPQNGGTGSVSYVSIVPDSTSRANIVCISSATVAGGGAGASGGAGGVASAAATPVSASFLNLATSFTAAAGTTGGVGSRSTGQINVTGSILLTPGTGGGGGLGVNVAYPGGNILANGPVPFVSGGFATINSTPSGRGNDGIIIYKPVLIFLGGTGGGCVRNGAAKAGDGGNGAYGCGGGGGGFSTSGPQGMGGRGGDGLVIITTTF